MLHWATGRRLRLNLRCTTRPRWGGLSGCLASSSTLRRLFRTTSNPDGGTTETLAAVEVRLAETICPCRVLSSDRVIFPDRKAPELLRAKWLAASR
jgi:hypothetical protein